MLSFLTPKTLGDVVFERRQNLVDELLHGQHHFLGVGPNVAALCELEFLPRRRPADMG
jgi:hypothetical protein